MDITLQQIINSIGNSLDNDVQRALSEFLFLIPIRSHILKDEKSISGFIRRFGFFILHRNNDLQINIIGKPVFLNIQVNEYGKPLSGIGEDDIQKIAIGILNELNN